MKVISLLNLKGGVAKSFTAVNLGYELWRRGYRVLLLDNDKQGNLSKGYGRYDGEQTAPITRLLNGDWNDAEELIQQTDYNGLDIITANMSLFGAVWNLIKESPADMLGRYRRLMDADTEDGRKVSEKYDYCIIDNPPDIGLNVLNALMVTDEVVVPVKIDDNALEGLDIVAEQIEEAKALNPSVILKGVLVTCYQKTDGESAGLEWLRQEWENTDSVHYRKYPILGIIRYSKKAAENSFVRKPVYEYSPCCGAAQDYKKFVTSYTGKGR
ncbi:MAG: ParA family protein [Dorea sp.]|nr:ParA family protein [Dorea sp.]